MWKKRISVGIIGIFMCMIFVMPISADQTNKKTVKVAYFDLGDYYQTKHNGSVSSYDAEYLQEISNYSNLKFEYVYCKTWGNALRMLKEHKIDLLGTMQWSEERSRQYAICSQKYGVTYASLVGLYDSKYVYEDYESFDNTTIGVVKNYIRLDEIKRLLANKNISPKFKVYNSQNKLEKGLKKGEVDMIATNSHTIKKGWKILEKYYYSPYYFATWKGNEELTEEIDKSLLKVNMYNLELQSKLLRKYFSEIVEEPFTKAEIDYIAEGIPLTVYFESNAAPMSYYDKDNHEMRGILIDVCNSISKNTGLKFVYKPIRDRRTLEKNEITYEMNVEDKEVYIDKTGQRISNTFFNGKYNLYDLKSRELKTSSNKKYTIAITDNRACMCEYINARYSKYKIIKFDGPEECLEAVEHRKVDFAFVSNYIASAVLKQNGWDDIQLLSATDVDGGICLKIGNNTPQKVISIINKGIYMINANRVEEIIQKYSMEVREPLTLNRVMQKYGTEIFISLSCIFIIILIGTIITIRNGILYRQKAILIGINKELEKANNAKSDFLSRMSHDIRTPMNAILGLVEMAEEQERNPKQTQEYLNKIHSSGKFLSTLINDILDVSKIESNALVLNPSSYDYQEFREAVKNTFEPLCKQKNITFNISDIVKEHYSILVDKVRLNQIIYNILSNSVKFTPENGQIDVIVKSKERNNKVYVNFTIKDTGIGMSKEFQEHMFDSFVQEEKHVNSENGSGLGLAIVKSLLEIMGGTIKVNSDPGNGTEFNIDLCFEKGNSKTQEQGNKVDWEKKLIGKKVLVCEDQNINAEIVEHLLEKVGIKTEWARNGKEGVYIFEQSEEGEFDAILMDVRMPVMNGDEATHAIRNLDRKDSKTIPIIAVTADAFIQDRQKTEDAGMNSHITKPIDPSSLYETLAANIA